MLYGLGGRLEDAHDIQPRMTVRDRRLILENAIYEMPCRGRQSLGLIKLWREHITRPVLNERVVNTLTRGHIDALVVNLYLFARLGVVVDDHRPVAADQRAADLHWSQPVNVKVRDEAVAVFE